MSFPKYPEYKDSGAEWLSEVPQSWSIVPLKQLADFVNGCPFKPAEWADSGTPIIRIENLNGSEQFNYFEGEVDPRYRVIQGELLFGWSGNRGTSFGPFLWDKPGGYYLNQHIFRVLQKECNKKWFYWCLKSVTSHVEDQAHGIIGMVHITKGDLGTIKVPKPPLEEQSTISAFLDRETAKIDDLVAEQEKLIELLKEKRQAVISHAVTKGLDPNVPMKDSGVEWLGEVPEHWDVKRLGALFQEVSDSGEEGLPILSVSIHTGVSDRELSEEEMDRKVTRSEDVSKYKAVLQGDLVYNMMRAWQGGFGSVTLSGLVSPAYVVARPTCKIETQFVEMILRTGNAIEEMRRLSHGVTDFRLRLYFLEFKGIYVAIPSLEEQRKILDQIKETVERYDSLSHEAFNTINLLKERRSALISAAVTGKIDVRELAEVL